jgi:hypothetical protein
MTGSDNHKDRLEDSTGPRIRHPSSTVYPNVIFMRENHSLNQPSSAAKLYQDILNIHSRNAILKRNLSLLEMPF